VLLDERAGNLLWRNCDAWISRIAGWRCVDFTHRWWAMRGFHASLAGDAWISRIASDTGREIHAKRGVKYTRGVVDFKCELFENYKLLTDKSMSDKPLKKSLWCVPDKL